MQAQDRPAGVTYGECWCGCGGKTTIADRDSEKHGWVKGEPRRYILNHSCRKLTRYEVRDCGHETPCWVWLLAKNKRGYGICGEGFAHRVMYEDRNGPVPDDLELDHLCRNRACVNPAHLEPVTHRENIRRGAATKLTAVQVAEIRELRADGWLAKDIAAAYGVSWGLVYQLARGQGWTDVQAAA